MNIGMAAISRPGIGQTDFGQVAGQLVAPTVSMPPTTSAPSGQQFMNNLTQNANNVFASAQAAEAAAEAERQKTYLILGGIALVGAAAAVLLLKKK